MIFGSYPFLLLTIPFYNKTRFKVFFSYWNESRNKYHLNIPQDRKFKAKDSYPHPRPNFGAAI